MKLLLIFAALVALSCAERVRFDNFKVYKVTPTNKSQIAALQQLEQLNPSYNFWSDPVKVGSPVHIMVPPHLNEDFMDLAKLQKLIYEVYMENVQDNIDATMPHSKAKALAVNWKDYNNLDEIYNWLKGLANKYSEVTLLNVGKSYEGRDILGVRVSFNPANENRGVFLEGGIHAREWIAPATVTYILNEILTSSDPKVRQLAESHDWYIFPNANPDGYVYTFTKNRMWRKTRQPYGICVGADPNRNWGWEWMNGGSSSNPCLDTYAGRSAFSEPETKALSDYIETIGDKLEAYIAFHSFSQLLLIPYGDNDSGRCENYKELKTIGDAAAKSLAQRYGTRYTVGNIVEVIYVASGGSMDWVKGNFGTRLTYTYELRDTGRNGFLLPKEQIIPNCEETMDSLVTMFEAAKTRS